MSWDKLQKEAKKSGGGMFIKLKDGDEVTGVFRGEPYVYYSIFGDKSMREYESYISGASLKFKIAFIINENGKYVAKVFQGPKTCADKLLSAKLEYGLDCIFKIKRIGSGKSDTRYEIFYKGDLTAEQINTINQIPLPRLQKDNSTPEAPHIEDEPPEFTDEDLY